MPKVCIVVPCFNQGLWVKDTIDSALAQTFEDFEIILVNDGSTDPVTNRICREMAHPKLRLIETENQGLAEARNTAIRETDCPYILPLDSDDRIAPTFLEHTVPVLEKQPGVGIVYTQVELFGEEQGLWNVEPYRFPDILTSPQIVASSLFRKAQWQSVGGYKRDMIYGWEDYDFWLGIIKLGFEVHRIPLPLFHYRRTSGSMAGLDREKMLYSFKKLYEHHRELYESNIGALFNAIIDARPNRNQLTNRDTFEIRFPLTSQTNNTDLRSQSYPIGVWSKVSFSFDPKSLDQSAPVRIDLGSNIGIYEIASLQILDAVNHKSICKTPLSTMVESIVCGGTTKRLKHGQTLKILSVGEDPYLYLPAELMSVDHEGPMLIEIWIHQQPDLSTLDTDGGFECTNSDLESKIIDLEERVRFYKEQETLLRYQMWDLREHAQNVTNDRAIIQAQLHEQQAITKSIQAELFGLQTEFGKLISENRQLKSKLNG
jgi:GT2 family glycosyltransferase